MSDTAKQLRAIRICDDFKVIIKAADELDAALATAAHWKEQAEQLQGRVNEAEASEERTQRLWDATEARLAEAERLLMKQVMGFNRGRDIEEIKAFLRLADSASTEARLAEAERDRDYWRNAHRNHCEIDNCPAIASYAARATDSAPAVEHYDAIWRTTPMPLTYTCYCGLYVHPANPLTRAAAIHISDCPYAPGGRCDKSTVSARNVGVGTDLERMTSALWNAIHHPNPVTRHVCQQMVARKLIEKQRLTDQPEAKP